MKQLDDVLRRAGGHEHAVPGFRLVAANAGFRDRRQIRQEGRSLRRGDGEAAQLAGLDLEDARRRGREPDRGLARDQRDDGRAAAFVRDVQHLDAGVVLEELGRELRDAAGARGGMGELAGTRFPERDELLHRPHRHCRVHHHHHRRGAKLGHRLEVLGEAVRQVLVERRVDGVRAGDHEQRVAVRRRVRRDIGADVGAGARPVFDHDLRAEAFRQPVAERAGQRVRAAARRERQDEAHRLVRIAGERRHGRQQTAGNAVQPHSIAELHEIPPRYVFVLLGPLCGRFPASGCPISYVQYLEVC